MKEPTILDEIFEKCKVKKEPKKDSTINDPPEKKNPFSRIIKAIAQDGINPDEQQKLNLELMKKCDMASRYKISVSTIEVLIMQGADVNTFDRNRWTPLHRVCNENATEIVKLLIENGACVNVSNEGGSTPFHYACFEGELEIVEFLISKGAEINARNKRGDTPLVRAKEYWNEDIIKLLIKHGAVE